MGAGQHATSQRWSTSGSKSPPDLFYFIKPDIYEPHTWTVIEPIPLKALPLKILIAHKPGRWTYGLFIESSAHNVQPTNNTKWQYNVDLFEEDPLMTRNISEVAPEQWHRTMKQAGTASEAQAEDFHPIFRTVNYSMPWLYINPNAALSIVFGWML